MIVCLCSHPHVHPPSWKPSTGEQIKFSNANINCIIVRQARRNNNQRQKHSSLSSFAPSLTLHSRDENVRASIVEIITWILIYELCTGRKVKPEVGARNKSCCIIVQNSFYSLSALLLPAHLFSSSRLSSEPAIWGLSYCGRNENVQVLVLREE